MATLSPSLKQLSNEVAPGFPRRGTSDGWVADSHHSGASDHQPDSRGIVHAIDIDKDGTKIPIDTVVKICVGDYRCEYVIFKGLIYSRAYQFKPRKYTGPNPHNEHIHISGRYGPQYEKDTSPWYEPPQEEPEEPMARAVKGHREATVYIIEGTGPALEFADPATYNEVARAYGIKAIETIDQDAFDLLKKAIGTKFVA